jgi:serine/threonine protein kinase
LHQAGLVYGDLGPASILLGSDKGGALLAVPQPPAPLEVGETVMADPPARLETVDPAVIRGEGMSRATDLWALGATMHLVLAQRSLHPGLADDDPLTAVQRVLFEPPSIDRRVPPDQAGVIASCLHPNPDDRPASAADVALALESLAAAR